MNLAIYGEGRHVGTWGTGPLDNDTAVDWCGALDRAAPEQRVELIRRALTVAADHGASDYLDSEFAVEAVAAAMVVASQLPGGPPVGSTPAFLRDGGTIAVASDLPALALRALDRVDGDNSELRGLWGEGYSQVVDERRDIRAALDSAAGGS